VADLALALQLRKKGKITTPGEPFEQSDQTEIDAFITNGVFRFEIYDLKVYGDIRIFDSRIVHEIKGKKTPQPYEKSRFIIQKYGNDEKRGVLIQSPII
jgi:hypothetical protein